MRRGREDFLPLPAARVCVCVLPFTAAEKILERQNRREGEGEENRRGGGGEMCDRGGRGDDSEGDGERKRRRKGGLIKKEEMDERVG